MHATVRTFLTATVALLAGFAAPALRADTVWVSSGGGNPIAYEKVKVIGIKGDQFTFRSATGRETSKPLDAIQRVSLDDDANFTAAEAAFENKDWDRAVTEYDKVVKATNLDWVKDRSTIRLIKAAGESGKFTAAAAGFLALLDKDPENATKYKPTVPEGKVDQIDPVIADVKRALADSKDDTQKQALMSFLMELQRGKGDTAAASATAEQLLKLSGDDASPELARVQAAAKLQFARVNIDQKKYKEALKQIDENAQYFTEPSAQVDALFCRADALAGLAGDDEAALKDAALAYMRVVAHFKNNPDVTPRVADALVKTGGILERLKAWPDALAAYKQAQDEFKDTPAVSQAAEGVARVQEAMKKEEEG